MFGSRLLPVMLLLASGRILAQTTEIESVPGFMTIQTSVPSATSSVPFNVVTDSCIGDTCRSTSEGVFSILPIDPSIPFGTTGTGAIVTSIVSETGASPIPSDTGVMSIPGGETPISVSSTPTSTGSGSGSQSATSSAASSSSSSTGAASPGKMVANDNSVLVTLGLGLLFSSMGFVWTLF